MVVYVGVIGLCFKFLLRDFFLGFLKCCGFVVIVVLLLFYECGDLVNFGDFIVVFHCLVSVVFGGCIF